MYIQKSILTGQPYIELNQPYNLVCLYLIFKSVLGQKTLKQQPFQLLLLLLIVE